MLDAWSQNVRCGLAALDYGNRKQALKQFNAALRRAESEQNDKRKMQASTFLGTTQQACGNHSAAFSHFDQALTLGEQLYGPGDIELAELHQNMGTNFLYTENYDLAKSHLDKSLLSMDSGSIEMRIELMQYVASARVEMKDYTGAAELCEQLHELLVAKHGEGSLPVATGLFRYSTVLKELGREEEAEEAERKGMEIITDYSEETENLLSQSNELLHPNASSYELLTASRLAKSANNRIDALRAAVTVSPAHNEDSHK